ncbi:phage tail-collar fiber domain-containing protein [Fusobacterium ulcerans]|uniref:Phage tail fibre protein N-terminal domain-containing protein n=1 Tax=Fusobacterium ulcerans 12-1B TaxID=457404 RepID=H1PTQ1_9FUSO|nr:phage tail protein [Fusobacterium ulcerans]EHO80721.1 hypothetical protein HMPREF0402_01794 [Fusobacterium ulcerans 12-1B]
MGYNGLTNFGIEYQARMTAENKPVTLTKVRVGNGSIPASQTGATTTNLYSYKKEVEILAKEQVENAVKLQILLNNLDQEIGFYVKELGVYVQDGAEEKLYWYINKDNPSYLDDKNVPSKHRYNLFLEVTNVETIIINFTGQGLLADKKYVDDSIADFESGYNATINELRTSINSNLASGTLPTSLNSGEKIYKALQGNGGLKFDENLLYLNDSGVKKTGYYYLDRLTEGIFECIEQTETMVNNSSLFKNISNKANSDKLENLFKVLYDGEGISSFTIPENFRCYTYFLVNVYTVKTALFDGTSTYLIQNNNKERVCQYGFYNASTAGGQGYNHISFKNWIITKSNSATVSIFLITNIIALF